MNGIQFDFPLSFWTMSAIFAATGALAAALANRALGIFHDGVRPYMPSLVAGEIPRTEVADTSFTLGAGFVWSYALPLSVGLNVPVTHVLLIPTDWIGLRCPAAYDEPWHRRTESRNGLVAALVLGALWGVFIAGVIRLTYEGLEQLPIPLLDLTANWVEPLLAAFILFPVLAAWYAFGSRSGAATFAAAILAWVASTSLDADEHATTLSFVAAAAVFTALAVHDVRQAPTTEVDPFGDDPFGPDELADAPAAGQAAPDLYTANVRRIRKAFLPLALLYGLLGAVYNYGFMAIDPLQGALYARDLVIPAALVAIAWAFAFLPMLASAAMTGCMRTGNFYEAAIAILMPSPVWAFGALFLLRGLEIWGLVHVVTLLERRPRIRELTDIMRTSMSHVLDIGFLVGGALAAMQIAGGFGASVVIAAWWINQRTGTRLVPMTVGPVAALAVGLFVNLLHVLGISV